MRTETLWQGERRAARLHWWRQVVDRPTTTNVEDSFDEILRRRFVFTFELESPAGAEGQLGAA